MAVTRGLLKVACLQVLQLLTMSQLFAVEASFACFDSCPSYHGGDQAISVLSQRQGQAKKGTLACIAIKSFLV